MGKGQETMRERGGREVGGDEVGGGVATSSPLPTVAVGTLGALFCWRGLTRRDMPNSGEW